MLQWTARATAALTMDLLVGIGGTDAWSVALADFVSSGLFRTQSKGNRGTTVHGGLRVSFRCLASQPQRSRRRASRVRAEPAVQLLQSCRKRRGQMVAEAVEVLIDPAGLAAPAPRVEGDEGPNVRI